MEQLHGEFAKFLYNTYLKEFNEALLTMDIGKHTKQCLDVIEAIVAHEEGIVDYVYSGVDSINSVKPNELKTFIRSRANFVLTSVGIKPLYEINDNPIADWFYQGINSIKVHDFFAANTTQYRKNWKFDNFSFFERGSNETNE